MKINILGSGAFASALAFNLAYNGKKVQIWSRSKKKKEDLFKGLTKIGKKKLNSLLKNIFITTDISASFKDAELSLLCIPAQETNYFFKKNCKFITKIPIIVCCKGIDNSTKSLQSEILKKYCPENLCLILSGPSFAKEMLKQKPTALTLACENINEGKNVQKFLSNSTLRIYTTDDIIGVQIGGALKNVIAIACGISAGKNLGESARIALMTRGFFEIKKMGIKMGGRAETFSGLSCLGDLCLTCNSKFSRNFKRGYAIGKKNKIKDETVEGLKTSLAAEDIANRLNVDVPIIKAVNKIINEEKSIKEIISNLISRPLIKEN